MAARKFKSKFKSKAAPIDMYRLVTDQIIALMEKGVRPWQRSWRGADIQIRPLRSTGEPYQGINVLILWMTAMVEGYSSPYWMSYAQAQTLGGQVRLGQTSTLVVLFKQITVEKDTDNEHEVFMPRAFPVYNCDQIDGLPAKYHPKTEVTETSGASLQRIPHVDAFFDALGIKVSHGGNKAFYVPATHRVQMPNFEAFFSAEAYYSTRGHESIHWTQKDLERKFDSNRFGDEGYAMEELVAEIGAAFLASDLGLANEPREDHASYIAHWLKILKGDKKAIFTAASYAQRAVKHLHGLANPDVAITDDVQEMAA